MDKLSKISYRFPSLRLVLLSILSFAFIASIVHSAIAYPATNNDWIAIRRNGIIIQDPNGDTNGSRNVVSDATHAAAYFANDGTTLCFRLRLDDDPTGSGGQGDYKPYGWGFEIDTNLNAGNYEWLIMLDGVSKTETVTLQQNTVQGILGDPSDKAEIVAATYTPVTSYSRVVTADTSFNGDQDYFLDIALPYNAFLTLTGLSNNSPIRLFEGSSSSAFSLTESGADLVGASDLYLGFSDYVTPLGQIAATGQVKFVAALDGTGDVTQINAGDTIYLAVFDNDQNTHLNAVDTVTITLKSGTTSDTETIVLTETGVNTGIFTASIPSAPGSAVNGNGTLQVAYGDTLMATYVDAVDANGNINQTRTDTALVRGADMAVSKIVNNPTPNVGNTVTYTVTVTNNGPSNATDITVSDQLPTSISYVSSTPSQGTYNNTTGAWIVGSLSSGSSATLIITATVKAGTGGFTISNTASVTSANPSDPNTANNTSSASITVQKADLSMSKSVSNTAPNTGNTITYTITLTNNGPNRATGVAVTDLLPSGVSYVSSVPSHGTYNNATGAWTVGSLNSGVSATLVITITVNAGTGGTTITNTASVTTADQEDTNTANNTASVNFTVQSADVAVSKTVSNAAPNTGNTITYTVTVTNNGANNASGLTVTDLLPSGVSYVSSTASQGAYNNTTGAWTISGLSNGISGTLTITATVNSGTGGTTIINTASVTAADQFDPSAGNNTSSVSITVQSADIAMSKSVNNPTPNVGNTVTYTITATNNGPNNATGVEVTDTLPAGVTYVSHTASAGTTYNNTTGKWTIGSLANGASATLTINGTVNAGTGGTTITNTANKTAADQSDPNTSNNTSSASITVQSADIAISKTVNNPTPNVSSAITYTITATNNGPNNATGVEVTDMLPAGVMYVSHTASAGTTYNNTTGKWTIGSLANGASATLTINGTVNAGTGGTTITNTASKTAADQSDPNTSNNTSSVSIAAQSADLVVSKTVNNPVPNAGSTITFSITVTNNGPSNATGIEITDTIPAGVIYASHTASPGTTYSNATGKWTVGSLASGASATLTITAIVNTGSGGSTITNTATVTAINQSDPNTGNNTASASIAAQSADIYVTKTVSNATPKIYDTITYTIIVTNNGPSAATNVKITDLLSSSLVYISNTAAQGTYDNNTGIWTAGNLANGASAALTITAKVNSVAGGNTISNTASVTSLDQADPNTANNQAIISINVVGTNGTVSITHTSIPGDTLALNVSDADLNSNPAAVDTVVVTVKNNMTGEIEQVTLTETGANTGVFSGILHTVSGSAAGTNNDGTMNTKAGDTVTITYQDALTSTGGTTVVTDTGYVLSPLLSITKVVDKTSAPPGDILTYTITYNNIGGANAKSVYVVDVIPGNTVYVTGSAAGAGTAITFQHFSGGLFDSSGTSPVTAVMWTLNASLPPGGSGTLTLRAQIK